jgi:hypothetical protein
MSILPIAHVPDNFDTIPLIKKRIKSFFPQAQIENSDIELWHKEDGFFFVPFKECGIMMSTDNFIVAVNEKKLPMKDFFDSLLSFGERCEASTLLIDPPMIDEFLIIPDAVQRFMSNSVWVSELHFTVPSNGIRTQKLRRAFAMLKITIS